MKTTIEKYARKCDITGKGMNEGWCWSDGVFYSETKEDTAKELRREITEGLHPAHYYDLSEDEAPKVEWSDDKLLEFAYESEICYYTEWYDPSDLDDGYYTREGKFIEN